MLSGRDWAMRQAGVQTPRGSGYNSLFGQFLARYELGEELMKDGDRSNFLKKFMPNVVEITTWRVTLPEHRRNLLHHPNTVLRHWEAFVRAKEKAKAAANGEELSEDGFEPGGGPGRSVAVAADAANARRSRR